MKQMRAVLVRGREKFLSQMRKEEFEVNTKYMIEKRMMKKGRKLGRKKKFNFEILISGRSQMIEWFSEEYH
jgi:hypothetical protein